MVFVAQLTLFYSTGITRYRDVSGSGAILKISNEAELDTPPRRLRASVTETWPLNARHARTPDEICPQGGKTHPTIKSALRLSLSFVPSHSWSFLAGGYTVSSSLWTRTLD